MNAGSTRCRAAFRNCLRCFSTSGLPGRMRPSLSATILPSSPSKPSRPKPLTHFLKQVGAAPLEAEDVAFVQPGHMRFLRVRLAENAAHELRQRGAGSGVGEDGQHVRERTIPAFLQRLFGDDEPGLHSPAPTGRQPRPPPLIRRAGWSLMAICSPLMSGCRSRYSRTSSACTRPGLRWSLPVRST